MLTIDEMLAPAAELPATRTYTFERLRGKPRLELLPMSTRNPRWFEESLRLNMKKDASKEPEEEALTLERLRTLKKESAAIIADTVIVGFAVQEEADGPWVPRDYTPAMGRSFLHRLIDLTQGIAEFVALEQCVAAQAIETSRIAAPDPTATAGNSSSG